MIEITNATRDFLRGCAVIPDEDTKLSCIRFYAKAGGIDPDDLIAAASKVEADVKKKAADDAAKAQRKTAGVEDERVRALILGSKNLAEVLTHVPYADTRKKKVWVNADGSFDTNLKASKRGNGNGKGRPKKDAPTGLVDVETGDEILGGVATFVKAQVEADNFGADLLAALYTDKGNMRPKDKVEAALIAHDVCERVDG